MKSELACLIEVLHIWSQNKRESRCFVPPGLVPCWVPRLELIEGFNTSSSDSRLTMDDEGYLVLVSNNS